MHSPTMAPLAACPSCGGELVTKKTEKLLRGGDSFATVTVSADVCRRCGKRLYTPDTVRLFEDTRAKLSTHKVEAFEPMGRSFHVPV